LLESLSSTSGTLVSRPEKKPKNIETPKVIARSRRRRSNLLQASENSNFHEMGLLPPDWIGGRNDLLWEPCLCKELLGHDTSSLQAL
jgi:hypothetical protein